MNTSTSNTLPRIEAAAILCEDGQIITQAPPVRHNKLRANLPATAGRYREGFLDSNKVFRDRAEAADIARASGQLTKPLRHAHMEGLTTDDLW